MDQPFIGQISPFGFNFTPRNWVPCNGQLLAINSFTSLFALIGTNYGGDGRTTMGVPDLRGRTAVNQGTGPGLSPRPIGQAYGRETVTLDVAHMPSHSHNATLTSSSAVATLCALETEGTTNEPSGNMLAQGKAGAFTANNYAPSSSGATKVALGPEAIELQFGGAVSVLPSGGNSSFFVEQPTLVVNYSMATFGLFPSRN